MATPKHKVSKSKVRKRRANLVATPLTTGKCENCGEVKQAHTVCPECGYYKNRKAVDTNKF